MILIYSHLPSLYVLKFLNLRVTNIVCIYWFGLKEKQNTESRDWIFLEDAKLRKLKRWKDLKVMKMHGGKRLYL